MLPQKYAFQGPTFKKGKLEGQATAILEVLDARGIPVSLELRERVQASTDAEELRHWLRRAAVVATADELFA